MRNSLLIGVLAVAVSLFCRSAIAGELFRYNFVEAAYGKGTVDVPGATQKEDFSMFGITGSYAVHELVAIQAGYGKVKSSFNGSYLGTSESFTANSNAMFVGVTLHKMISSNTELGLDLARNHSSIDSFTANIGGTPRTIPSSTDNSNSFAIRARTAIIPEFRLLASAGRTTGGSSSASTDYAVGAEYELGKDFALGAGYALSTSPIGDSRGFSISGRYYY